MKKKCLITISIPSRYRLYIKLVKEITHEGLFKSNVTLAPENTPSPSVLRHGSSDNQEIFMQLDQDKRYLHVGPVHLILHLFPYPSI